jgi:ubiquinone/menaquinone biosynthesis C-methylase UbiE
MTLETNLAKTGRWKGFFDKFSVKNTVLIQKYYIEEILNNTKKDDIIMEIAAGSGYTSIVLLHSGRKNVICSDIEDELLEDMRVREPEMISMKIDSFNIPFENGYFDCIFHQGFLEHFADKEIIDMLNEQARVSKKVIFDVPNARRWDRTQEYGNERFLYHTEWRMLIQKTNLRIVKESGRKMPKIFKYLPQFIGENAWFRKHFGTSSIFVCEGNK